MRVDRSVLAIAAVSFLGIVTPRTATANEWDKQTVLTFSQDVEIPGRVLPAGVYIFKLADSPANRNVMQVFDQAGRLLATVLTIPATRLTAADDTRIYFDERPAGAPIPIKKWFYPGDLTGEELIYRPRTN